MTAYLGTSSENLSSRTFRCGHHRGLFTSCKTNKQLFAEVEVSSSSSDSSLDSPTQDLDDLQDHSEDWLILDEL